MKLLFILTVVFAVAPVKQTKADDWIAEKFSASVCYEIDFFFNQKIK